MKKTIVLSLLILAGRLSAAADGAAGTLAGVWESDRAFGPEVRGDLSLERRASGWVVSIGPYVVAARENRGTIEFSLPGGRGDFRGRRETTGSIAGHWRQPARVTDGTRYATPIVLTARGHGLFRGAVLPLEDRLTLDLVIERRGDGTEMGFLRNPQQNAGARLGSFAVTRSGSAVTLAPPSGKPITGRIDPSGFLSFVFPFADATFDFVRKDAGEAFGVVARIPSPTRAALSRPPETGDGWSTAAPAGELDEAPIASLVAEILARRAESVRSPAIQSLLIARHGKLVVEEYFGGFSRDEPHDFRSASKSLASLLVGAAIARGAPFRLSTPVYPLFPGGAELERADPRRERITVENLLTMTTGWDCDDYDEKSPGNEDTMQEQTAQTDWYRFALALPGRSDPGGKSVYCTASMNLLGGVVAATTGMRLEDAFLRWLAEPLGITRYHVNLMPDGSPYLGGGMKMRPRDFLKFGQLLLDGGAWNGRRVVSRDWIARSIAPHASQNGKDDYGYLWHIETIDVQGRRFRAVNAGGNGGQLLIVLPELDVAVVITAGNYGDFLTWSKFEPDMLSRAIIPAALGKKTANSSRRAPNAPAGS